MKKRVHNILHTAIITLGPSIRNIFFNVIFIEDFNWTFVRVSQVQIQQYLNWADLSEPLEKIIVKGNMTSFLGNALISNAQFHYYAEKGSQKFFWALSFFSLYMVLHWGMAVILHIPKSMYYSYSLFSLWLNGVSTTCNSCLQTH